MTWRPPGHTLTLAAHPFSCKVFVRGESKDGAQIFIDTCLTFDFLYLSPCQSRRRQENRRQEDRQEGRQGCQEAHQGRRQEGHQEGCQEARCQEARRQEGRQEGHCQEGPQVI